MTLQFAIRTSPTGGLLADWSNQVRNVSWSTGAHGFQSLRARISRSLLSAFEFYRASGALHVEINAGAYRVWEGRLDDPGLMIGSDGTEVEIQALGYWQAYRDLLYTAHWSTTDIGQWDIANTILGNGLANTLPDRFAITTNQMISIAPEKNSLQGGTAHPNGNTCVGAVYLRRPDRSDRLLQHAIFDYSVVGAAPWTADLLRLNDDLTIASGTATPWSQVGSGSGTFNASFAGCGALALRFYNSGTNGPFGAETGTHYLRVQNPRINGESSATTPSTNIVNALIAFVRATNPSQADAGTYMISSTGIDLDNEIYEDAFPADILDRLALLGDAQDNRYEVGVKRERRLYFRPKGSAARRWQIDATGISVQQSRELLSNSVYGRYQGVSGRTLRTATASDAVSQARFGIVRSGLAEAETTKVATAEQVRDTFLGDTASPHPRTSVSFERLFTANGQQSPLWMVESGDIVTIRNLPTGVGADIDRIRTFYVAETEYDSERGTMTIVPDTPITTLDVLLARKEAIADPPPRRTNQR